MLVGITITCMFINIFLIIQMINLCFKDDKPSIVTLEYQFMQRHKCFNIFQTSSPIHLPSLHFVTFLTRPL